MPLTLYGYILRELLKVLGAAALVLTVVMSVAFAIMSVSQGLLGPWAMVKIMVYVLPGMLTIALPFAAALAGTLVFFRMSQDNEITACAVGGISYMGLLGPVLVLGLGMTGGMFWFSNWVVPRFWKLAEREGTSDAVRVVVGKIQRREVFEWDVRNAKLVIYADAAEIRGVDPGSYPGGGEAPYSKILLQGVAVGRISRETDAVLNVYTAGLAVVDLYRDPEGDRTRATMVLTDVSQNDPLSGGLGAAGEVRIGAVEIPTQFSDRPQFMSLRRLQRWAADPQRSPNVYAARSTLVEALAHERILDGLEASLSDPDRPLELAGRQGHSFRIVVPAVRRQGNKLALLADDRRRVGVTNMVNGVPSRRYEAEQGSIEFAETFADEEPRVTLVLERVTVQALNDSTPQSSLKTVPLPLLAPGVDALGPLKAVDLQDLLAEARTHKSAPVVRAVKGVDRAVDELQREIAGRVHERAAMAVNCSLVLALGVVMSMWLRMQTPLTIFFWCFMPTVVAFLTISSGQQVMGWNDLPPAVGAAVLWSGNVALAAMVAGVYLRLRRN